MVQSTQFKWNKILNEIVTWQVEDCGCCELIMMKLNKTCKMSWGEFQRPAIPPIKSIETPLPFREGVGVRVCLESLVFFENFVV